MEEEYRRFTISVPKELAAELTIVKQSRYADETQGEMLRDLIARGVQVWQQTGEGGVLR